MPRLFTGLKIPRKIAAQLAPLQFGLSGAKWIEHEDLHITLRFFGNVDHVMADEIVHTYDQISAPAFELELAGLGAFGGKYPRMVWAGIAPSAALSALQRAHETTAQTLGLSAEGRKFIPHVTLTRLKQSTPLEVAEYLKMHSSFKTEAFPITEFILYSARTSRGGGPYIIEQSYPLSQ